MDTVVAFNTEVNKIIDFHRKQIAYCIYVAGIIVKMCAISILIQNFNGESRVCVCVFWWKQMPRTTMYTDIQ